MRKENLIEKKVKDFNFKQHYEEKLPPDADELVKFNAKLMDNEGSKDEEINNYKRGAE